uniref:Uncharacterized protein n=1 Tax=Arundo donax TaxID=35708 RepID=A0A0A9EC28_ARUDO
MSTVGFDVLAILKGIITKLDGTVWMRKGTVVPLLLQRQTIFIPVVDATHGRRRPASPLVTSTRPSL